MIFDFKDYLIISKLIFGFPKRKWLNVGTVPMHHVGTVPMFKMHQVGTVPTFKTLNVGTLKK